MVFWSMPYVESSPLPSLCQRILVNLVRMIYTFTEAIGDLFLLVFHDLIPLSHTYIVCVDIKIGDQVY